MQLDLFSLIVDDYDTAIDFFVNALQFTLVEDKPSLTNDGRAKRWVVVRPPCGGTGCYWLSPMATNRLRQSATNSRDASAYSCALRTSTRPTAAC